MVRAVAESVRHVSPVNLKGCLGALSLNAGVTSNVGSSVLIYNIDSVYRGVGVWVGGVKDPFQSVDQLSIHLRQ